MESEESGKRAQESFIFSTLPMIQILTLSTRPLMGLLGGCGVGKYTNLIRWIFLQVSNFTFKI